MDEAELDRLQRLADAAKPGSWGAEEFDDDRTLVFAMRDGKPQGPYVASCPSGKDAVFVAAAREGVPALIAYVRRLTRDIAMMGDSLIGMARVDRTEFVRRMKTARDEGAREERVAILYRLRELADDQFMKCDESDLPAEADVADAAGKALVEAVASIAKRGHT